MCRHCEHAGDFSRRDLLATAGVVTVGSLFTTALAADNAPAAAAAVPAAKPAGDPEVRVRYPRPQTKYRLGWPGTSWDPEGYRKTTPAQIQGFADTLKVKVTFEPEPLYTDAEADAFVKKLQAEKPQGVIVMPLHMVRAYHDIRKTKVVVVRGNETREQTLEPFGLTLRFIPRKTFPDVLQTIGDTDEVKAMAADFKKRAKRIVEPTDRDILNAARNYCTALKIIKDNGCDGITMDCLGLVSSREIPTPPCMGWRKLMDVGLLGICEADLNAVMSQLLCMKLLDKPGFQQEPVPNTVDNTFIGAHCACPTRLNGFDKDPEPFVPRNHAESALGVSLRVLFKVGQEVMVMQMTGPAELRITHYALRITFGTSVSTSPGGSGEASGIARGGYRRLGLLCTA